MRRAQRILTKVAATSIVFGVLSMGGVSAASVRNAPSVETLQMWARADDVGFLPALVKSFNATHSTLKIDLTLVPDAEVVQKYSLAASTGSGPDIVSTEIGTMATFTPTNWYQNITSLVNSLPYRKYLSPAHLGQATYDGEIKGIPFTADVSVLYWNKTLFSKAGLNPNDPPANWAQIAADATKIRTLGGNTYGYFFSGACAGCMAFTMLPYVWAQGGNILKENSPVGTPTLYPNNALLSTLTFYRQLWASGAVAPTAKTENGTNQFGLFFNGTIGMFVQGTYPFSILKTQYPKVKFGVELVPSMNGQAHASVCRRGQHLDHPQCPARSQDSSPVVCQPGREGARQPGRHAGPRGYRRPDLRQTRPPSSGVRAGACRRPHPEVDQSLPCVVR